MWMRFIGGFVILMSLGQWLHRHFPWLATETAYRGLLAYSRTRFYVERWWASVTAKAKDPNTPTSLSPSPLHCYAIVREPFTIYHRGRLRRLKRHKDDPTCGPVLPVAFETFFLIEAEFGDDGRRYEISLRDREFDYYVVENVLDWDFWLYLLATHYPHAGQGDPLVRIHILDQNVSTFLLTPTSTPLVLGLTSAAVKTT